MHGDIVQEVAPDGTLVSEWRSWEHLSFEDDIICPLETRREWTHCNALNVTSDKDLLVSFRQISVVGIVDRTTGDFRWKWAPDRFRTSIIRPIWATVGCCCSTMDHIVLGAQCPTPGSSKWMLRLTDCVGLQRRSALLLL